MPLSAGTRLGSYEIVSFAGAGGMGEVYRALDPRLGRVVAIKILSGSAAVDADRLRRFEQEARAAGRLDHPNVLVVHDVGTADGVPYLVSEFLDGETLRARLDSGKVSVPAALDWALQIGRGLQAAHEKGIVHRDLKPENVFLTTDGRLKILDFGLAKLAASPAASAATVTGVGSVPGLIVGTVGYMSPEQLRGDDTDHRTDIFAFGALLHELLTGRRAFGGHSDAEVMSAVLRDPPADALDLNPNVPPALNRVLQRCLEKHPGARFQSAADLCFTIETLTETRISAQRPAEAGTSPSTRRWLPLAGWFAAAALALAILPLASNLRRPASARAFVASLSQPEGSSFGTFVVSPDGRWLAFTDDGPGTGQLWIRTLDQVVVKTTALAETDDASNPFWSPDSRSIGFFAASKLKIVDIGGGRPITLCDVSANRGGTWNRDGLIVFAPDNTGGLYQIPARERGTMTPLTRLDPNRKEQTHRWPSFLPDGRHFLYFARTERTDDVGIYVASTDDPSGRFVSAATTNAVFAPPESLLFVRDGALIARRFDLKTLTVGPEQASLVSPVGHSLTLNRSSASASDTGVLVYGGPQNSRPVWLDRAGKRLAALSEPDGSAQVWLAHETTLIVERPDARTGANDIHIIELDRGGISSRFTTDPGSDTRAVWLPKTDHVAWASNRKGVYDLFQKPLFGPGEAELLLESGENKLPTDGSPDGRFLLFDDIDSKSKLSSIRVLPLGDRRPFPLLDSGFSEAQARFSPDGRWIAYTTDKDGSFEVYVVEAAAVLPAPGQSPALRQIRTASPVRVSTSGGTQPMWRRDGRVVELFYLTPDRHLMSVVAETSKGFRPRPPVALFELQVRDNGHGYQTYAVTADGQRFLALLPGPETSATVIFNWTDGVSLRSR